MKTIWFVHSRRKLSILRHWMHKLHGLGGLRNVFTTLPYCIL